MDLEERKQIIDNLIHAVQRYRSMSSELSDDVQEIAKEIQPVTLGDDFLSILLRLSKMDEISGHDFYNVMTLAAITPEIQVAYNFYFPDSLPEPHIDMVIEELSDD